MTEDSPDPGLLTADELRIVQLASDIDDLVDSVVMDGEAYGIDARIIRNHIQAIQRMVLAQAAARAYPQRFRLLGGPPWPDEARPGTREELEEL